MVKVHAFSRKPLKKQKPGGTAFSPNNSEWSDERLQEWAEPREGEPPFMGKLKQMLLTMIREGKAAPDGTDREGNPTFSFK